MQTLQQFNEFFYRHFDGALAYACKLVAIDDAEDVVQFAFIKVWQYRGQLKEPVGFLYTCIKHKCFDLLKRKIAQPLNGYLELPELGNINPHEDNLLAVQNQILKLKPINRRVIELALIGYSNKEIASLLKRSEQTIKNIKRITIKQIKKALA